MTLACQSCARPGALAHVLTTDTRGPFVLLCPRCAVATDAARSCTHPAACSIDCTCPCRLCTEERRRGIAEADAMHRHTSQDQEAAS